MINQRKFSYVIMKNKFAYLLKRGATWNLLKPLKPTWNHPETTWNHLKPLETSHTADFFLLKINYSQVAFILILHPKVLLGQIWSPKLSSPNWPEFGTEVHCQILISNLIFFFKIMSFIFFGASLVPKSKVIEINWNLVWGYIAIRLSRF